MADDPEAKDQDRRRSARVNTQLLTQIAGVDTGWVLRRCNISVTGMLLELDNVVGETASVQQVRLRSPDERHEVAVLARVVRTLQSTDLWRGAVVVGVALDFLVQNSENRAAIETLMHQVMQVRGEMEPSVQLDLPVQSEVGDRLGQVQTLGFTGMVLRASAPLMAGAQICCQITPPGTEKPYSLEGEVMRAAPLLQAAGALPLYEMEVRFAPAAPSGKPTGLNIGDAIDALLEEAVFQAKDNGFHAPREQLKGMLSRIRLPSLLTFMEMERMSGTLSVIFERGQGTLFLRSGHVVDCQATGHPAAMPALQHLLGWSDGDFEFRMGEVDRPDVVQMSTTHLLLKLTTEAEARH